MSSVTREDDPREFESRPRRTDDRPGKPSAFEVDGRIACKLDVNLARCLAELILSSGHPNPAIMALGHKLQNESE